MRIMGFSEHWPKLQQADFTTFRVPRKDKDWHVPEIVQVVYRPRSKNREPICLAEIRQKEVTTFKVVTEAEAIADGFANSMEMWGWLKGAHKGITVDTPINKLYLAKLEPFVPALIPEAPSHNQKERKDDKKATAF